MDAKTEELRDAHDVISAYYAEHLATGADELPVVRAVLSLFCDLITKAGLGVDVIDVGCGTGRLEAFLAKQGLSPRGFDLSHEMVRVARRDHPAFRFDVADLRLLPLEDAQVAGVLCWYSLIYLAPEGRPAAYAELARVVRPGGYLLAGFKTGDGQVRRGGRTLNLGVGFDVYWLDPVELERQVSAAGFTTVFRGGVPDDGPDTPAQGYLLAQRC